MKEYRYVILDPTGNLTGLVLDPPDPADEAVLTRELLKECEQVAYLEPPSRPEATAGIRLMGGEFCGNASMAAAAWLVRDELRPGEEKALLLEVSGAESPVLCTVRKTPDGCEGTVEMPGHPETGETAAGDLPVTAVRLEGILHLVYEGMPLEKSEAEDLLRKAAGQLPDKAVGLLHWERESQYLTPLVYVKGSESLVWERGCGSGSAAVGVCEAVRKGQELAIPVNQPGGTIRVSVTGGGKKSLDVSIGGKIRIGEERIIRI